MKTCPKCMVSKDLSEFHVRTGKRAGKPASYCKVCMASYSNKHYMSNKQPGKKHVGHKKYREKCRDYIRDAKRKPCTDCGIQYPYYVMQFDHLFNKTQSLATFYSKFGMPKIKEEISKCEVVCANCHAVRTYNRRINN